MSRPAKMRVVIVEPGRYAREAEIDNTLEAEQAVVGGLIDVICPWPDDKACLDRKSTRLNSSHLSQSRMPSSA